MAFPLEFCVIKKLTSEYDREVVFGGDYRELSSGLA
jgi:hypothetical protein